MSENLVSRSVLAAVFACVAAGSANAATLAAGGTDTTGAGGFTLLGGGTLNGANLPGFYSQEATDPASEWVWSGSAVNLTFLFEFNLTGAQIADAVVAGKWGIDNVGSVFLNGNVLSTLPNVTTANFATLTDFSTSEDSFFTLGTNVLSFVVSNAGGPAGFRASVKVTADGGTGPAPEMPAIPLPASLPLLAGAVALLGLGRSRSPKKKVTSGE